MRALDDGYRDMLLKTFRTSADKPRLIGVEIEAGVVDRVSGVSLPYHGTRGVGELLRTIANKWACQAHCEAGVVVGAVRDDGVQIALEPGCSLEYVSTPQPSLGRLVPGVSVDMSELAGFADGLGMALLSGSMLPFDTRADVTWAPKPRVPLMLDYFDREVGPESQGWAAMAQVLTVQTTLDYQDEEDLARLYLMSNVVSPMVAALFVNSPIHLGRAHTTLSRRMQIWANVDARRTGIFRHSVGRQFRLDDMIDWLLTLPPIFRTIGGTIHAAPHTRSFGSLLMDGYGDGTYPTEADWTGLMSTTWPYVRLRDTIELRVADGPGYGDWPAIPALWVGLAYDRGACEAALELAGRYDFHEYLAALNDVAIRGLRATIGNDPIRVLCREMVNVARIGLKRRVELGIEPDTVVGYLDPLVQTVEEGVTPAERLLTRWVGDLSQDPQRYVQAYRYH